MWLPPDKYSVLRVMKIGTLQQFLNRRNCSCRGKAEAICFSPQLLAPSRGPPHPHPRPRCVRLGSTRGHGVGGDGIRHTLVVGAGAGAGNLGLRLHDSCVFLGSLTPESYILSGS